MSGLVVGPQDVCVHCGEAKAAVEASQRTKSPIFCATVDPFGECSEEWERHRFTWTESDRRRQAAEEEYWAAQTDLAIISWDAWVRAANATL